MAQKGRPLATAVPDSTSRATSVAVSKPSPKRMPTGYIFHGGSIRRARGPKNRFMRPRCCELPLELFLVEPTPAHVAEDPDDRHQDDDVEAGDEVEEGARHRRADDAGHVVQRRARRCAPGRRAPGCRS